MDQVKTGADGSIETASKNVPPTHLAIAERLRASDTFAHYADSFRRLTGLPLSIFAAHQWPPAARGGGCSNAFCAAMLTAGHECTACAAVQRALERGTVGGPQSVACLAGICETGIPIRAGAELIGFLVVGPLVVGSHSEKQLNTTLALMARCGLSPARRDLARAYNANPAMADDEHAAVVQMLITFAEHLSLLADRALLQEQPAEPAPVLRARKYIEQNVSTSLRLDEVARSAGLSTTYFSRMFKRTTQIGFSEYVSRVRIEQAKELLLNPNMQVQEVAFAVGFGSVHHFNRIFKKLTGVPPGEYRQSTVRGSDGTTAKSAKDSQR